MASPSPAADAQGSKGDDGKKPSRAEKGKNPKEKGKDAKPNEPKKKDDDNKGKDAKPSEPKKKDGDNKGKDAKPSEPKKKDGDNKGKDAKPSEPKKKDGDNKGKDAKPNEPKKKDGDNKGREAKTPAPPAPTSLAVEPVQPTQPQAPQKPQFQGRASDLVQPTSATRQAFDAESGSSKKGKKKSPEPKSTGNLNLLRDCYNTLALGNRVYDGHRRAAMNHLDKAAQPLGGDFSGNGPLGREPQALSDAQLTSVKTRLERGRGSFTGPALEHVDTAIKELGIALSLPDRR